MGVAYNTSIVTDGLVFGIDAANPRCYSGSGITVNGFTGIGATLVGGVGFTTTNYGSFVFDGVNDYINVPHNSSISAATTNAFSLSAWFLSTVNGTSSTLEIVNKRNNTAGPTYVSYGMSWRRVSTTDTIFARLGFTDNSVSDLNSTDLLQNVWYFATETFDGTNHRLYINGTLNQSGSVSGKTILDDGFSLTINSYSGSSEFLAGNTSAVLYYNRALSPQEIQQNFAALRGRYGI